MESYCWEVKPSVEIQKNLSVEVTYKWRHEECVGDTSWRWRECYSVQREQDCRKFRVQRVVTWITEIPSLRKLLLTPPNLPDCSWAFYTSIFTCLSFCLTITNYRSFSVSNNSTGPRIMYLNHDCIPCNWHRAGYGTSWCKCLVHYLTIHHCHAYLPVCQPSVL